MLLTLLWRPAASNSPNSRLPDCAALDGVCSTKLKSQIQQVVQRNDIQHAHFIDLFHQAKAMMSAGQKSLVLKSDNGRQTQQCLEVIASHLRPLQHVTAPPGHSPKLIAGKCQQSCRARWPLKISHIPSSSSVMNSSAERLPALRAATWGATAGPGSSVERCG